MTSSNETSQVGSNSRTNPKSSSTDHIQRKHPCVLCQQRKVKCDRNDPCSNCTKARVQCISPTVLAAKKRKKRFPEAELLARLRRYENHLRAYGADIDAINNETAPLPTSGAPVPCAQMQDHPQPENLQYSPGIDAVVRSLAIRRSLKHVEKYAYTCLSWGRGLIYLVNSSLHDEISNDFRDADELLRGESEDELLRTPLTKTFDAIQSDGSDFIFPTPSSDSITDIHPSSILIFRLWNVFLDNVNPLVKIFHAPSVQQQMLDAIADLENVSKGMEALMFSIYSMAITSLSVSECMKLFGEERAVLLARYQAGSRQALSRAGLLRSSDMTILQAFVLYLISCLNFNIDPRSHFCLSGIAVRIAQRMGLNFDGTVYGLSPFETEMRRRLWYQIVFHDTRVTELSGGGCSIITYVWNTKPPSNVNDSDLSPDMREPPLENECITEMVYIRLRCDIVNMMQKLRSGPESLEEKDKLIHELGFSLQARYNRLCDPSVPLHLISTLMCPCAISKLAMGPRHPHMTMSFNFAATQKDTLFILSLHMLESHNAMIAAAPLKRFLWHICTNFPFPAHVYLLSALRQRPTDPLAERAWAAFGESFVHRKVAAELGALAKNKESALQLALASLTVRAWDARERAVPDVEVPHFIPHLRCRVSGNSCAQMDKEFYTVGTDISLQTSSSTTTTSPPEVVKTAPCSSSVPNQMKGPEQIIDHYQWLNSQPAMQFDMASMGAAFDDEMMQGLMPTTNESSPGYDFWNGLTVNGGSSYSAVVMGFDAMADNGGASSDGNVNTVGGNSNGAGPQEGGGSFPHFSTLIPF